MYNIGDGWCRRYCCFVVLFIYLFIFLFGFVWTLGSPFGSYVDYILDDNGWPVLLLSEQSLHTVNIKSSSLVSLFCQLPRSQSGQSAAALSRVTLIGVVEAVKADELSAIKLAFSLVHQYAGNSITKC